MIYRRVALHIIVASNRMRRVIRRPASPWLSMTEARESRQMSTDLSHIAPNVEAPNISQAREHIHVRSVSEILSPTWHFQDKPGICR